MQAEGNSLRCILQPVYCTPSPCILHTLTLYTAHPHPVYCTPSPCILHTLTLYPAHPHPVSCTPSPCILHTLTLYTAHPHPALHTLTLHCTYVLDTVWACRSNILHLHVHGGDLDAFGKPVHKDCFQKCIHVVTYLKFTGGF